MGSRRNIQLGGDEIRSAAKEESVGNGSVSSTDLLPNLKP
jgi:hypothetical protein